MSEIRVNINPSHTSMSTYHLWDKTITLKAKGLLSQMLSLPREWDYSIKGLVEINKESIDSINSALRELKDNGYLTVTKQLSSKDNGGKYKYTYDVYETPQNKCIPEGENPPMENPHMEFPPMENPVLRKRKEAKEKEIYICDSCTSYSLFKEEVRDSTDSNDLDSTNNIEDISSPKSKENNTKGKTKKFIKPTVEEVRVYCEERQNGIDAQSFIDYNEQVGWVVGTSRKPMKDWKAAVRTWENKNKEKERQEQKEYEATHYTELDDIF